MRLVVCMCMLSVLFTPQAFAHGGTPSLEADAGSYRVDIGYDRQGIRPNEEVTFDFDLWTRDARPTVVPFHTVQVTVRRGEEVMVKREVDNTKTYAPRMAIVFPTEGSYNLDVRYVASGTTLAAATFPVQVAEDSGTASRLAAQVKMIIAVLLTAATVMGMIVSYVRSRT